MKLQRIGEILRVGEQSVEAGAVYVLHDPAGFNCRFRGQIETLHVMSSYVGGEIRGYWRERGAMVPWKLRHPAYPDKLAGTRRGCRHQPAPRRAGEGRG